MSAAQLAAIEQAGLIEVRDPAEQLAIINSSKQYQKTAEAQRTFEQALEQTRAKIAELEQEQRSLWRRFNSFLFGAKDIVNSELDSLRLKLPLLEQNAATAQEKLSAMPEPQDEDGGFFECGSGFVKISDQGREFLECSEDPENLFLGMNLQQAVAARQRLDLALQDRRSLCRDHTEIGPEEAMQLVILAQHRSVSMPQLLKDLKSLQTREDLGTEAAVLLLDGSLRYDLPLERLLEYWERAYKIEGAGDFSAAQLAVAALRSAIPLDNLLQSFMKAYDEPGINDYAATELACLATAHSLNLDKLIKNCKALDKTKGLGTVCAARLVSVASATNTPLPDVIKLFTEFYEVRGINQHAALYLTSAAARSRVAASLYIEEWRKWFGLDESIPGLAAAQLAICTLEHSVPFDNLCALYRYPISALKSDADATLAIVEGLTSQAVREEQSVPAAPMQTIPSAAYRPLEELENSGLASLHLAGWVDLGSEFFFYGMKSGLFLRH